MKRIVILGAGESGAGAAVLAKKQGFDVFVSDMSAIKDKYKKMLDSHGISWEEGRHTEAEILNADEIIKSPGIPCDAPMVRKCAEKGIPHNQRDRVRRPLHRLEDDLHHRQQRQDYDHFAHLPHIQERRLRRGDWPAT